LREGRDQVLQEEQQVWRNRAKQRLEQADWHLSENEHAALPVIVDAFSSNHSRAWSDDEDEERPSYSPAPLILDLYASTDHMPASSDIKRREAVQTSRRRKFVPRAPHVMSAVSSTVLAAVIGGLRYVDWSRSLWLLSRFLLLLIVGLSADTLLGILSNKQIEGERKKESIQQCTKVVNTHLDKIGELLGFQEKLTTYVFRYSYANLAKQMGYSKDIIAEALGHEYGNAVTGIYLEQFDQEVVDKMNQDLIEAVLA
jgi:hypothetical protein